MNDDVSKMNARDKVAEIFREMAGEKASRLGAIGYNHDSAAAISAALASSKPSVAEDVAFHLSDWAVDAAFIVAVQLFPERFTATEIEDGIEDFLIHAPNHVAAAAALFGYPVEDIFGVAGDGDRS